VTEIKSKALNMF